MNRSESRLIPRPRRRLLPRRTVWRLALRRPGLVIWRYRWPLVVLLCGAVADGITTYHNMRSYGIETEMHPAQRLVSQVVGIHAGVPLAKAGQLFFVLLLAAWWRPWCGWMLLLCGVLYGLAAVSNHFLLI